MILNPSIDLLPGNLAPDFTLPDTRTGKEVSLASFRGQAIVITFLCNHCPYVIHLLDELVRLMDDVAERGVKSIAISANDVRSHPQDNPTKMAQLAEQYGFQFPYCFDETQQVARAYGALCTPDIFLFDADHGLYYHGQFDDTRPGRQPAHGSDLRQAIDALLAGTAAPTQTSPSVGCSIKWKK